MEVSPQDFQHRCNSLDVGHWFFCRGIRVTRVGKTKWAAAGVKGNWRQVYDAAIRTYRTPSPSRLAELAAQFDAKDWNESPD